jgi:hypothetical protein
MWQLLLNGRLSYGIWAPAIITICLSYLILYLTNFIPLDRPEKSTAQNLFRSAFIGAFANVVSFSFILLFDAPFALPPLSLILAILGGISGMLFWLIVYRPSRLLAHVGPED